MFDKDYTLTGKHATYAKYLKNEAKLYEHIVDVYMNGAVFGLLYNRRADRDSDSKDKATIFADAFANRRERCVFLYRLVMLLEKKTDRDTQTRIDRAFRDDADEERSDQLLENLELFHEYVRGGIEVMYERFIEGGRDQDEFLEKAMDFMEDFADDLCGKPIDDRIAAYLM